MQLGHVRPLPGFDGQPIPHPNPTITDYGHWLTAAIDEAAPRRAGRARVVLGHGIGGSVAFEAAQREGIVDAWIFHAPVGPDLDRRLLPILMRPRPVRRVAQSLLSSSAAAMILRRRFANVPTSSVNRFVEGYRNCEAFAVMFDILNAPWFDGLHAVSEPSVLVWGSGDGVLNADHVDGFDRVLPEAGIIVEPDWAHYPMLATPEHYRTRVAELARGLIEAA